jgi:two-component system response regulator YesN
LERLGEIMYKVLIADDEEKVCKLINNLIDWEQFGLTVAAMIQDGVTALHFIQNEKPDIVITDIRMPGYDGIELIRQAKEINPEINFIIVSGYRHFDYAHNAIRYGVEDYLLKPLKKAELVNTLTKMIQRKEKIQLGQNETADMKRRIHQDEKIMKQTFLEKILLDASMLRKGVTRENLNQEFYCDFIEGDYLGIIIKPDLAVQNGDDHAYRLLMEKAKDITQKELGDCYHEVLITISKEGIVCLVNDIREKLQGIRKQLKSIRSDITRMRDVFINVQITIGIGEAVGEVSEITATLRGAKAAVLKRLLFGTGHILTAPNYRVNGISPLEIIDYSFRSKFLNYIETLHNDGILQLLAETKCKLESYSDMDGEAVLQVCREIYEIFSFGIGSFTGNNTLRTEEYEKGFYRNSSLSEVFQGLQDEIGNLIQQLSQDKKISDKKPIRNAKQYIKENYTLPITLEEVSGQAGFNATYFSTLFKKETGKNFLEYLTDTRVQAAKQLLSDTGRSINQVSEEVGYNDIKHFTKVFKKTTGLTPTEYRKLYY